MVYSLNTIKTISHFMKKSIKESFILIIVNTCYIIENLKANSNLANSMNTKK